MRKLQATSEAKIRAAINDCPASPDDLDAYAYNLAGVDLTEGEVIHAVAPYISDALIAAGILR